MSTMACVLFFLALLNYCGGVSSQPTVTQPASETVLPGQTVRLTCSRSAGGSWAGLHWLRQKPGQAPHFVLAGASTRGEGIPDRFTGSGSGNTQYLSITNAQEEDEADYYCITWERNSDMAVFGGGTRLTVTGQPTVSPSVLLFPPSQEQIKTSNKATLVCLIDGFYPSNIHVTWRADSTAISSGVETSQPTKQDDKYVASSYLTMSESDWEHHETYSCKVTHEGKSIEKSVNRMGYS